MEIDREYGSLTTSQIIAEFCGIKDIDSVFEELKYMRYNIDQYNDF